MEGYSPPSDPNRPACPYLPGFVMHATEYEPPAPSGAGGHGPGTRRDPPEAVVVKMPQTRQVLECPPQNTRWPHGRPQNTATLTIMERIPNGRDRRAKLAVCQVHMGGDKRPYQAVAKIYDPLYYIPLDSYEANVVARADEDYSREALAYSTLQTTKKPQLPGFAPAYYGSWSVDLPLVLQGKAHKRPVRLILIEHIQGTSLRDLYTEKYHPTQSNPFNAFHYDEAYRLDVVGQLLEGTVRQLHAGVYQRDIAARNIMVSPTPHPEEGIGPRSGSRVVLIDYNQSVVYKYTKHGPGYYEREEQRLPPNPAQYYWKYSWSELGGWCPDAWFSSEQGEGLYQDWLIARFVLHNGAKFAPIEEEHPIRKIMRSFPKGSK